MSGQLLALMSPRALNFLFYARYLPTQRPFSSRSRLFKQVEHRSSTIAIACASKSLLEMAARQGCIAVMSVGERKC
jgi:hypothetical protein